MTNGEVQTRMLPNLRTIKFTVFDNLIFLSIEFLQKRGIYNLETCTVYFLKESTSEPKEQGNIFRKMHYCK